jgi:nanoRNase/pAp phosphatase (c-di-AMP/oligoRNAs hydrolase)
MAPHASPKSDIGSIAEKNRIVRRIGSLLVESDGFLLVGHRNPDEDCIASMVAFGLLASKLNKEVWISLRRSVHEQFAYLLNICSYNSIHILRDEEPLPDNVSVLVAMDTPKPEMLETDEGIDRLLADPSVRKVEIDHHLGSDSAYIGDEGYRLVATASSASELVGYLALKMANESTLVPREAGKSLLARNFVLAVLTGIIADSRMGKYLKTKRERLFYERFSAFFDGLLAQKTNLGSGNFTSKEEVFKAIASLSSEEDECYRKLMESRGSLGSLEYVILDESEIEAIHDEFGEEILTTIAKAAADALAEEGGRLGLVAYPDHPSVSELQQFRLRRCHSYRDVDLRDVLTEIGATNGGGHPGAVGFRFPKTAASDFRSFAMDVAGKIEAIAER